MKDFLEVLELIQQRGASLTFLDQPIDCDSPAGKLMINMLASFAEFERELIQERVQAGVDAAARANGKQLGRPPVDIATHPKAKALRTLVEQGTSISEAARSLGVARSTAHRWLTAVA